MNARIYRLGTVFGYRLTAGIPSVIGSAVVWILLALAGGLYLNLTWTAAGFSGLACILLHWLGEIWHQAGHAAAARRTGYPMESVHFGWILGFSRYPQGEPDLPAGTHLRRAIGGPAYSLLLTILAGLLFFMLPVIWTSNAAYWISLFFFMDNLLIFTLGAMLPLGFTDGSTILRNWNRR